MMGSGRVRIRFTIHAVERFVERVRPGLDFASGRLELWRLAGVGTVAAYAPGWLPGSRTSASDAYLVVGDMAVPLVAESSGSRVLVATTVVVRGTISPAERKRRTAERNRRRQLRRDNPESRTRVRRASGPLDSEELEPWRSLATN